MPRVKVDLVPMGDRVMVIPVQVSEGTGVVGLNGNEIVKSQRTIDLEEWQQSEAVVFKHGTGVPKWLQKQAPRDTTVVIARHTASSHRIPIGPNTIEFLLVPSHGILMVKRETEVVDDKAGIRRVDEPAEEPSGESEGFVGEAEEEVQ